MENLKNKVVIVGEDIEKLSQEVRDDLEEMMTFNLSDEFDEELTQHDMFEEDWENINLELQYGNVARACFFREDLKRRKQDKSSVMDQEEEPPARPARSRVPPIKLNDYSMGYR